MLFFSAKPFLCALLLGAVSVHAIASPYEHLNRSITAYEVVETTPTTVEERGCSTNAECLKRGLPLLKPTRRRLVPRAGPSSKPMTGQVVMVPAGSPGPNVRRRGLNYKRRDPLKREPVVSSYLSLDYYGDQGVYYQATQDSENALRVTFDSAVSGSQNLITNKIDTKPYLCGLVPLSGDYILKPGTFNYAFLTQCTNPGDPYTAPDQTSNPTDGFIGYNTAAAIWQVDSVTGQITALWTNPTGTDPLQDTLEFAYASGSYLLLTADFNTLKSVFGNNPVQVDLYVVLAPP